MLGLVRVPVIDPNDLDGASAELGKRLAMAPARRAAAMAVKLEWRSSGLTGAGAKAS